MVLVIVRASTWFGSRIALLNISSSAVSQITVTRNLSDNRFKQISQQKIINSSTCHFTLICRKNG